GGRGSRFGVGGCEGGKNGDRAPAAGSLVSDGTGSVYNNPAIKHAHESFDIDHPGRDSYRLREAGARRVLLSSPKRWALMHELGDSAEMSFENVLSEAGTCDLGLVEGFKREPFPKIELRREGSASRKPLTGVPGIVAVASDRPSDETSSLPIFHLDDIRGISDFITRHLNLASR